MNKFLRLPFGFIGGSRSLIWRGALAILGGYALLTLGGWLAGHLLPLVDPATSTNLKSRHWVRYWSKTSWLSVSLAFIAGAAGAQIMMAQRSVLSAGVMIALALIPSLTITGMALAFGDWMLAWERLKRWGSEAFAVLLAGFLVLAVKQAAMHRRRSLG